MGKRRLLVPGGPLYPYQPLSGFKSMTPLAFPRQAPATAEAIAQAARILAGGGLVAFPTETVYGLGADAGNGEAVAGIFAAKGRPRFNPLIVHVASLDEAERHGEFSDIARKLARAFWPGALTLVVPRRADSSLSLLVSAGLDTVALRVPSHPVARELLRLSGRPIAAPSANVSGAVSATTALHVAEGLDDKVDFILDGGPAMLGLESTVIGFDGDIPVLLRPGAIAREEIEAVAGKLAAADGKIRSPGQLESHYAPRAALRLNADTARSGEVLLGFGDVAGARLNLSPRGDLKQAAANLFAMLRELDKGAAAIAVSPIPDTGLGEAINDRLQRAAAPRGAAMSDAIARLKAVVGKKGFSEDQKEIAPHLEEWRSKYQGKSSLLLKPASTAEVSAILAICHETGTAIVPQGGNTGLVGGQIPFHGEVLLSLARMNRIRGVDAPGMTLTAEAGVVLAEAQAAAAAAGLMFPLTLASEGSCTIGGNIATNAGGNHVLRYGMMRALVLGLEVVLADGRVLPMLKGLHKDNSGYDLKQLFIGSEGTLGVVTAATLRLFSRPAETVVAFAAVPSPAAALALLGHMQARTGGLLSAFELIPRIAVELVVRHIPGTRDPLAAASPWYVLMEVAGGGGAGLEDQVEAALADALAQGLSPMPSSRRTRPRPKRCGSCAKAFPNLRSAKAPRSSTIFRCPWPRCPPLSKRPPPP